jgi:transposase
VTTTMTYVGLDVHARSTQAAALNVVSGELERARFGGGSEEVIAWLARSAAGTGAWLLRGGPTGFALYRAAQADRCAPI